jgi:DNA-binding transcriptional MocR family regulator
MNTTVVRERLYERVADHVQRLIQTGALHPGDRIPSVRQLSKGLRVSITTVVGAYQLLEDRGFVRSRPQSGYYVRARISNPPPEPESVAVDVTPSTYSSDALVMEIVHDLQNPRLLPLSAAVPSPDILPIGRLSRMTSAALRHNRVKAHLYDSPPGWKPLREQIARRAILSGISVSPDDVLTTSGCQEAINLCLRAVCSPGDIVAVESPGYYGTFQAIKSLGLRALEVPTHPREGICIEPLERALQTGRVKACVITPNFNNPLGSQMSDERKALVVALAERYGVPLIEDDIYGDLSYSIERPKAAKAWDRSWNVMLCSSFSKTLAPGYRVGWVLGGRWHQAIERLRFCASVATPTLAQMSIADFLAAGGYDHYLRRARKLYAQQVAMMSEAICRHFPNGTRMTQPMGGFVLWIQLPRTVDAVTLYAEARRAGVSIAPGPIFSAQDGYRNFIRLNAGRWSKKAEQGIALLGTIAKARA